MNSDLSASEKARRVLSNQLVVRHMQLQRTSSQPCGPCGLYTCCVEIPVRATGHGHESKAALATSQHVCQFAQKTVSATGHSGWPAWRHQDSTASQGIGSYIMVASLYPSCTWLSKSITQPVRSWGHHREEIQPRRCFL